MCGIAGFIDYNKKSDKNILSEMIDRVYERGPDDKGLFFKLATNYNLGLAHRRLSILDLSSAGHQPMSFENLVITYNGEVYNFKEIRKKLETYGYSFHSNTDTEVILKAFHKWGVKAVDRFKGMFAFAIYDKNLEKIYLFRDRAGVKPLYYYWNNNIFLFGSEIKTFYPNKFFEKQICFTALSDYFRFGYINAPLSIFENTFKLLPGTYLEFDIKSKKFSTIQYWNIQEFYKNKKNISYDEAKKELENILTDSFKLRMVADVPVGSFLSGGIDSSLVTAILQKHTNTKIKTFTIGFENEKYNEAPYAKKIAEYLGTEHYEYYCTEKETMEIITKLPDIYDEPFADISSIPTALVSKVAKQEVKVVLSGDGGDEVFGGYTSYYLFLNRYKLLNKVRKFKHIINMFPSLSLLNDKYNMKLLKIHDTLEFNNIANMFRVSNLVFSNKEIKKIMKKTTLSKVDIEENLNDLEKMMIIDFLTYLPNDILTKVDRATMGVSLEGREPLLDNKIIEYAASLPIEFKIKKRILKDILANYIPRKMFERKKTGFGIPINDWLRNELRHLIDYYFSEMFLKKIEFLDKQFLLNLKERFLTGKNDDKKIWTVLMFIMWYEKNMKGIK